jgi:hypothetical protein
VNGRLVQPLGVVDHAHHRAFQGRFRQQGQCGHAQHERVRHRALTQAERNGEREVLRSRQRLDSGQQSQQHTVQRGVRKLHLRLDPGDMDNGCARRGTDHALDQGRLANTGLASHHQHRTEPLVNVSDS